MVNAGTPGAFSGIGMSSLQQFLTGGAICALAVTAVAPLAHGQEAFERDRNTSVRQRAFEENQAAGIRAGSFLLFPQLDLGVEWNDNIYAASTGETDDTIFTVAPSFNLNSQWSVHQLNLFGSVRNRTFADASDDNTTDWQIGADGRLDVTRDNYFLGNLFTGRLTEPRYSASGPANLREPVEYDLSRAGASFVHTFNRVRGRIGVDFADYNFKDSTLFGGGIFDQDFRDRQETDITGRLDYAVSPDTALFGSVTHRDRNYDQAVPNRDSKGWRYLVGANFDLSTKIRGEVGVGYSTTDYDNAAFRNIDGFAASARVEWFPTELTSVTLTGVRDTIESDVNIASGVETTGFGARVDHSLRRNVILNAGVSYDQDDYKAIDREDDLTQYSVGAEWYVNRVLRANAGFEHRKQDSSGLARNRDFDQNAITVGISLRR